MTGVGCLLNARRRQAASKGLLEAAKQTLEAASLEEEEAQAACMGRRKGIPLRVPLSDAECAEQLLSAREILRLNPALEDAKCESRQLKVELQHIAAALRSPAFDFFGVFFTDWRWDRAWRDRSSEVEALILCRRYDDALQAARSLRPGVTKLYLEAEVVWRDGDPSAATERLEVGLRKRNIRATATASSYQS